MKIIIGLLVVLLTFSSCKTSIPSKSAPTASVHMENWSAVENYRASYSKHFELIHTVLRLKPDWKNKLLYGHASIRLKPYFYETDLLILDAKGMEIHSVEMTHETENTPLEFVYENDLLRISLDKSYNRYDSLTVEIHYTSRPEEILRNTEGAVQRDKGLYFINADSSQAFKPTQLWTHGEPESNSVWFPTIEDPAQRMTQEIYITVDSNLKTISNGLHLSSVNNPDGSRTDYWKQNLPLAPYLTMIAVSDFSIVRDRWNSMEVSYYLDKEYEKYARLIFGNTTEMISFFSNLFHSPYPWEKYSQVVVHEYISGAMENNTAVIYGTHMLQDSREHRDYNHEDIIVHELAHHWFGNLVTCESWANIALNEGFASYCEYLWKEYKYGRDEADYSGEQDANYYLRTSRKKDEPLIRFHYHSIEDVFDPISYQKGARVLHMLRKTLGDDVFFTAISYYLEEHKYSAVEFHHLRLAFEKVSGRDLNWFFNQWFSQKGKPSLDISTDWNEERKELKIQLKQTQNLETNPVYRLELKTDFYFEDTVIQRQLVLDSIEQSYTFYFSREPILVNVDSEKMLLLEKKNDRKSNSQWIYQYHNAPLFLDRKEAVKAIGKKYRIKTPEAEMVIKALDDKHWNIRIVALESLREIAANEPESVKDKLLAMAKTDSVSHVRVAAYEALSKYYPYKELATFYQSSIPDSSYLVQAIAFNIISQKDSLLASKLAVELEKDSSEITLTELASYYSTNAGADKLPFFKRALNLSQGWSLYTIINDFGMWLQQQPVYIIREGSDMLASIGIQSSNEHISDNSVSAIIKIQNSIDDRIKTLKKSVNQKSFRQDQQGIIAAEEVELMQLESVRNDLENKIKNLERHKHRFIKPE